MKTSPPVPCFVRNHDASAAPSVCLPPLRSFVDYLRKDYHSISNRAIGTACLRPVRDLNTCLNYVVRRRVLLRASLMRGEILVVGAGGFWRDDVAGDCSCRSGSTGHGDAGSGSA